MKKVFLIFTLFFIACHARSQEQSNPDTTLGQSAYNNTELNKMILEDSVERYTLASHYFERQPNTQKGRDFIANMIRQDSERRAKIHEWMPGILAHGTAQELKGAGSIMAQKRMGGDTSDYWDAYQLATRAVSLGDSSAKRLAEIALGEYISKHGTRINVDSVLTSWRNTTEEPKGDRWFASFSEALAEAQRSHKNIFIDFSGYTATNCRAMEQTVFSRDDVKKIFKNFVLARLYTDDGSPSNDSNQHIEESRFKTMQLPFYVILSPENKLLATFPGFTRDAEAFKRFLALKGKS